MLLRNLSIWYQHYTLDKFANLKELYLIRKRLRELPAEIDKLQNLKILDLVGDRDKQSRLEKIRRKILSWWYCVNF